MLTTTIPTDRTSGRCDLAALSRGAVPRLEAATGWLGDYVSGYTLWQNDGAAGEELECWVLPGDAQLRIVLGGGRVAAQIGNWRFHQLPGVSIAGPSSRTTRLVLHDAGLLSITLTPLGWSRLIGGSAAQSSDRIVDAQDSADPAIIDALRSAVCALPGQETLRAGLDPVLAPAIVRRSAQRSFPDDQVTRALTALIETAEIVDAGEAARALDVMPHVLRRTALRHFGFPPKLLLMRRRFLCTLAQLQGDPMGVSTAIAGRYFDASHFLRDANRFLGMTPRRFLSLVEG